MDVPSSEVTELKAQITALSLKVEVLQSSIQEIMQMMARQEGSNFPLRLYEVEIALAAMKIYQAERSWIPKTVEDNKRDITQLRKFQFLITGGLVVSQFILTVIGKVMMDKLWPHQ